jgi:hypothetical protein
LPTSQSYDFISKYISLWREALDTLSHKKSTIIRNYLNSGHSDFSSYCSPCQIEVVTFKAKHKLLWIVTHDSGRQDAEITIVEEQPNITSFFEKQKIDNPVWYRRFNKIIRDYEGDDGAYTSSWSYGKDFTYIISEDNYLSDDVAKVLAYQFKTMMSWIIRFEQRQLIDRKTEDIKNEAEKVVDVDQRSRLIRAAEEIKESLGKLKNLEKQDQRISAIEGEITGVRKLIGESKEYQDWRLLVEDVAEFKRCQPIKKDLFESEIKRLDQRIDSLKEIKVSSKRAALEVVLALVAASSTIIAALLAAGIIHF